MQLSPDHGDVAPAIEELDRTGLKREIAILALSNVIEWRKAMHKPRGELRRRLELLRAIQIAEELRA